MRSRPTTYAVLLFPALAVFWLSACTTRERPVPPVYGALPDKPSAQEAAPSAGRLPTDTQPESYDLWLHVDPRKAGYSGQVKIELMLDRPRTTLWLHNRGPRVSKVRVVSQGQAELEGQLVRESESGLSAVRLAQPVGPGSVRLSLQFEADFGERLTGLYRATAEGEPYAFTQFEPTSAREAFPCFDEPRFKTPFHVRLRVGRGQAAIANTRVLSTEDLPDGSREHTFATTEKLPTYLVALAVGPFDVVDAAPLAKSEVREREVPLRGVAVKGRGPELLAALRETPALLTRLEDYFGTAYPYDKLDLIAVPDFGAGAMENAGAITFRDTLLLMRPDASEAQVRRLAYVNAHELAHQWFGNLVTMPWWDDLWLNESFATWMGTRVVHEVYPEYDAKLGELYSTHHAMDLDSQAAARQIRQPIESDHDIENAFDSITYAKGGAVLSMFERYLGEEAFRRGLRLYMERHRFANATAEDLMAALSAASQRPELPAAFSSFLQQPGVPTVAVELRCTEGQAELGLTQRRYAPIGSSLSAAQTWQIPLCVRYAADTETKEQCALLSGPTATLKLDHKGCPKWLLPNAGAAGYYRYALAPADLDALLSARDGLTEGEQMSLAHNLTAAFRAGDLKGSRLVPALEKLAQTDTRQVRDQVLGALAGLERQLLDPGTLASYRALISRIAGPPQKKLGLYPKPGAQVSGGEKLSRASLTRAMAYEARDPALLRELSALGRASLDETAHPRLKDLPNELIDMALTAALRAGDEALLTRAIDRLLKEGDGTKRSRLLSAISALDKPELSERVLSLALHEGLRTNERTSPLFGQMGRRETREASFAWLKAHHRELSAVVSERNRADVIAATRSFCSLDRAAEVETLFAGPSAELPGGPRELQLALESIRLCAALDEAQGADLRAYFTAETKARRATPN